MISWKIFRTACIVLLLLPIVHLTFLMSRDTMETLDNSPEAWAREVDNYAKLDADAVLPKNPIVVVGGRRVKLWPDLEGLLAPRPVLMRGIGDAIVEDITFNYSQVIGFYQPDTVVLLPGNSEFHVRDNKSAAELVAAIQDLVALDASYNITRRFYIFTPVRTLLRPQDHAKVDRTTQLLEAWEKTDDRIVILDVNPLLSGTDGLPRDRYFRGDGVNLNEHGYLRLSMLLLTQLEEDTLPVEEIAGEP
jgi:hypothetical protein